MCPIPPSRKDVKKTGQSRRPRCATNTPPSAIVSVPHCTFNSFCRPTLPLSALLIRRVGYKPRGSRHEGFPVCPDTPSNPLQDRCLSVYPGIQHHEGQLLHERHPPQLLWAYYHLWPHAIPNSGVSGFWRIRRRIPRTRSEQPPIQPTLLRRQMSTSPRG